MDRSSILKALASGEGDVLNRRDLVQRGIGVGAGLAVASLLGAPAAAWAMGQAKPSPAKITVWCAGYLNEARPGTPVRKWLENQSKRFSAAFPGSSVEYVLQPANNSQFLPILRSAFASGNVPDVMCLYSGGYTVDYGESLTNLRPKITPQYYRRFSGWDLACAKLDCSNGNAIYGDPIDLGGLVLFYNKALFAKAGVPARAFRNWTEFLAAAQKLKDAGIQPTTMGNRDGYSAANWVAAMFGSYISNAQDVNRLRTGELKWNSPKMVKPVAQYDQLWTMGFTNRDARTREQVDANGDFVSGKAAMVGMFADHVLEFREGIGNNLAVMRFPPSANGPLSRAMNVVSGNNWVVPKDAKNAALAWEFVKLVSDGKSQTNQLTLKGTPPTNKTANLKVVSDPVLRTIMGYLQTKPSFLLLDNVVQADIATVWYSQLALAFAGRASAASAMTKVEQAAKKLR